MRKLAMLACLIFAAGRLAAAEYLVVQLPITVASGTDLPRSLREAGVIETEMRPGPHGSQIDGQKTDVLNALAADGWRVIAVTSAGVGNAAVYLARD